MDSLASRVGGRPSVGAWAGYYMAPWALCGWEEVLYGVLGCTQDGELHRSKPEYSATHYTTITNTNTTNHIIQSVSQSVSYPCRGLYSVRLWCVCVCVHVLCGGCQTSGAVMLMLMLLFGNAGGTDRTPFLPCFLPPTPSPRLPPPPHTHTSPL
jgi:hypothetical protein